MQAHLQNQGAIAPVNLWTAALHANPTRDLFPLANLKRFYPDNTKLRPLTMAMGGMFSMPVWTPLAARKFVANRSLKDLCHNAPDNFDVANQSGLANRPWFGRCNIAGENIKCFVKAHPMPVARQQFMNEISLHQTHLFPLHGTCILPIYGVWARREHVHIVSELPHHTFWMTAHPSMPEILKKRVIDAVSQIHARGVVHGTIDLHDILIGADARVSIVNFDFARVLEPVNNPVIGDASPADMRREMKKVQCMIDYPAGIADRERERWARFDSQRIDRASALHASPKHQDTLPVSGEMDDEFLDDPPVHLKHYDVRCYDPVRFIVPGKAFSDFVYALEAFETLLEKLEHEDRLSKGLLSPAVSPQPEAGPSSEAIKVEEPDVREPRHRYPTRKRKEPPAQTVTRASKRTRKGAAGTNVHPGPAPSSQLGPSPSISLKSLQASTSSQSEPVTPRKVLSRETDTFSHESVVENNARSDRPPVIIRDYGFIPLSQPISQPATSGQDRGEVRGHHRSQAILNVSEKAKGKRKAGSDDDGEKDDDNWEPGEPRPSAKKKPRLVHTAAGINAAVVRFNDAPDVYFNSHRSPRDSWWQFPRKMHPPRRPHPQSAAGHVQWQDMQPMEPNQVPRQPVALTRSDSLIVHSGRTPPPLSRHDSVEVHTGMTPPPPSRSYSFDLATVELEVDSSTLELPQPQRRVHRRQSVQEVPAPAPFRFTFTFPRASTLQVVYNWVGSTLGFN